MKKPTIADHAAALEWGQEQIGELLAVDHLRMEQFRAAVQYVKQAALKRKRSRVRLVVVDLDLDRLERDQEIYL